MDYLTIFEKYKDIKDIADLIKEINELREYYNTMQFEKMHKHINKLTTKYFVDTIEWNSINTNMPSTEQQAFINAESFLKYEGSKILLENSFKEEF